MSIYKKRESVGSFFKKGEDIKNGDLVEIANEGKQIEGNFGIQDVFLIKLENGKEGNVNFNQTTINGLIDAFGEDSIKWVGKQVKVWSVKQNVSGKFLDVYYFSHPKSELTEEGFILSEKDEGIPIVEDEPKKKKKKKDDNDINVEDIPY